jgi:hypothetical protein
MQNQTTIRTRELSPTERHIYLSPTITTSFTRSSGLGVLDYLSTAHDCFVGQHLEKSSPRNITNMLGQVMIPDHIIYTQFFNCYERICFSETMTELMQEISPLVDNLEMLSCNFQFCFSSVTGAFDFPAQPSLQTFQSRFSLDQMSGISYEFVITEDCKISYANINTDLFGRAMLDSWSFNFTREHSKPLTCFVALDSECLNLASGQTMKNNRNITNLGSIQSLITFELETRLRESETVDLALEPGKTNFNPFTLLSFFYPAKEVIKGFAKPVRYILQNLAMDSFQPRITQLKVEDEIVEIILVSCPELFVKAKKFVIGLLTTFKRIKQSNFLLRRRIQSEFIHAQFHEYIVDELVYILYGHLSSVQCKNTKEEIGGIHLPAFARSLLPLLR